MDDVHESMALLRVASMQEPTNVPDSPTSVARGFNRPSTVEQQPKETTATVSEKDVADTKQYSHAVDSDADLNGKQGCSPTAMLPSSMIDLVIKATHTFIQRERQRNFHFLGKYSHRYMEQEDLLFARAADSHEIESVRNRAGYHAAATDSESWYTFTEPLCRQEPIKTVLIEVLPGRKIVVDNLIVIYVSMSNTSRQVLPLAQWLRDTYEWNNDYDMRFQEMQYDEQRLWWDRNGMAFRFMDLPAEMRDAVYLQVIGPVILPDLRGCNFPMAKFTLGVGVSYGNRLPGSNRDPNIDPPNMAIMRVSKKVKEEATEVAYRNTIKRFRDLYPWNMQHLQTTKLKRAPTACFSTLFTGAVKFSPHAAFLRHVQLEMSAKQYFLFIGISPMIGNPFRRLEHCSWGVNILSTFTALQDLDFRFFSPKHPDSLCPWYFTFLDYDKTYHSCQKVWIDWFFVFAWEVLKAVHAQSQASKHEGAKPITYSLSGCVKNSTRRYWQHVLNDTHVDHTAMIKARKRQIIRNKTDDNPIPCKCTTPCTKTDRPAFSEFCEYEVRNIEGLQEEVDKSYWDFED